MNRNKAHPCNVHYKPTNNGFLKGTYFWFPGEVLAEVGAATPVFPIFMTKFPWARHWSPSGPRRKDGAHRCMCECFTNTEYFFIYRLLLFISALHIPAPHLRAAYTSLPRDHLYMNVQAWILTFLLYFWWILLKAVVLCVLLCVKDKQSSKLCL